MSKNVTFIDDLPFLDEIMNSQGNQQQQPYDLIPNREYNQIKKFIRNTDNNFPPESGMSNIRSQQQLLEEQQALKQQQIFEEEQRRMQLQQMQQMQEEQEKIRQEEKHKNKKDKRKSSFESELSCINVAEHTADCIVCSKLYNTDHSIFYGIIIVLVIICLILLKRVVEK
jgi:hypothetical protein